MSALPARLTLVPDMSQFGLSIAVAALADSSADRTSSLVDMWHKIEDVRRAYDELRPMRESAKAEFPKASALDLITLMELTRKSEESQINFHGKLSALLLNPRFKAMVENASDLLPFTMADLLDFLDWWKTEPLLLMRHIRMSCIIEIYRRAASLGIDGADLGGDFSMSFLSAPLEETDAWQETAHLLASPENARFLLRSISSAASDRTEELFNLPKSHEQ